MIDAAAPETKLTMSVQEMAYQLGIGRNKAYELVKQRDFPAVRIGGNYRVISDKLPDWLNKQAGKTYYFLDPDRATTQRPFNTTKKSFTRHMT